MARTAETLPDLHTRLCGQQEAPETPVAAVAPAAAVPPPLERLVAGQYLRWLPIAGLWFAFAFLIAFGIFVNNTARGGPASISSALYATVPHFMAWALLSPVLYRALYEVVKGARRALAVTLLAAWGGVAIGASTVSCYLGIALRERTLPTSSGLIEALVAPPLGPPYQAMNLSILVCALAAFAVLLAFRQRARAEWTAAQSAVRVAQMDARLAESRLQALQARMNPHFLLNSLNAIAGFVQSGRRDDAFDTVARLGTLLRQVLSHGESPDVSLGEELAFAVSYMELLKMRFGQAFSFSVTAPDSLRERRVPALVVQPLIENAVRHGMEPGRALHVEVRAYEHGPDTVVEVTDDGRGIAAGGGTLMQPGHGLANVAERLRIVFGEGGQLSLAAREPHGTCARLSFAA